MYCFFFVLLFFSEVISHSAGGIERGVIERQRTKTTTIRAIQVSLLASIAVSY